MRATITCVPTGFASFFSFFLCCSKSFLASGQTKIEVQVDAAQGLISVFNDGRTVPVVLHKTEGVWMPELVFGHLLTGSNFDDSVAKATGGRNGYGAKLANIFSKSFTVEIWDPERELHYKQTWRFALFLFPSSSLVFLSSFVLESQQEHDQGGRARDDSSGARGGGRNSRVVCARSLALQSQEGVAQPRSTAGCADERKKRFFV